MRNARGEGAPHQRTRFWVLSFLISMLVAGTFSPGPNLVMQEPTGETSPGAGVVALAEDEKLASWNPNVSCTADRVTIAEVLGPAYPAQRQKGGKYEKSQGGGVPHQRALSPPCTITNKTGQVLSSLVQIEGVYIAQYGI